MGKKDEAKNEPKVPKEKVEKFSQNLKVTLTPHEIAVRADRAANLVSLVQEKDEERKAANKHAQGEIDQLTAELSQLSNEVRTRATYKQVECERRFVYADGVMRETRLDTFDLLNTRKLTEHEMQPDLPFPAQDSSPADELWRPTPLEQALKGMPKRVYDAFEKAAIYTMGDFSDFQAKHGEFWIKDLDGVGPGMAEKISDAAIAFWAELKSSTAAAEVEEESDDSDV